MSTGKIIASVVAVFVLIGFSLFAYYGGFKKISVSNAAHPQIYMAYKIHIGDYSKSYTAMQEVEKFLKDILGTDELNTGIGIYFDAPGMTDKDSMRSAVGYVISENEYDMLPANEKGVFKTVIPAFDAIYADFPFKGVPSFIFAVKKVYPAFYRYIVENEAYAAFSIEIYDMKNKLIKFYMPSSFSSEELIYKFFPSSVYE